MLFGVVAGLAGCAMLQTGPAPVSPAVVVFFQPQSAALDAPADSAIAAAAQAANAQAGAPVTVTGAADTVGNSQANELLSQSRAEVVADALVKDGVGQGRITVRGVGEAAAPAMADGSQFSRRVVIQIGS